MVPDDIDVRPRPEISAVWRIKLVFMACGLFALVLSVALWFGGNKEQGIFVGLWVPTIHSLGTLVLAGGDRT